jgi:hypothetical protein
MAMKSTLGGPEGSGVHPLPRMAKMVNRDRRNPVFIFLAI